MLDPKKYFISPQKSIKDAIKVIDRGAAQVALVVENENKLVGIVTDGDIRRAILKGVPLKKDISTIMTPNPVFIYEGTPKKQALQYMRDKVIHHVPVVDSDRRIKELIVLDELLLKPSLDNPVVIMAGGKGERLRPYTENCPKPMLPINGKPMMEIILERCISFGFKQYYFSVNYLKDEIISYFGDGKNWGVDISYLEEDRPLGTAGSLSFLPNNLSDDVLVINGDVLSELNFKRLLDFHRKKNNEATVCSRNHEVFIPFAVLNENNGKLMNLSEKPTYYFQINAGVYILSPKIVRKIPHEICDITDLLERELENGEKIGIFPIHEKWSDIGSPEIFREVNNNYDQ
jgi:dTDP-glucose pyrophosphorylase